MTLRNKIAVLTAGLLLVSVAPMLAHHAFSAEFDHEKSFTVTGTVTKIEWTNPHIWIYIDVKDKDGKVTNWGFQGGPPSYLMRSGWNKNDLKVGETVTMQGFKAKDGSNLASGGRATLPNGRKVFAGTPDDGSPGAGASNQQQ